MSEREDQGNHLQSEIRNSVVKFVTTGKEGIHRISRIEGFGVFSVPQEFIWGNPSLIAAEDKHKLFSEPTLHVGVRLPQEIATGEMRRVRFRGRQPVVVKVPESTLLTLDLAYPGDWNTSYHVETRLHLEGEQATIHKSRKVEVPEMRRGQQFLRHVTLQEETPRPATLEELQIFGNMLSYVQEVQAERERIRNAPTQPLRQVMPTQWPVHRL